jgi:N-acetylmuramoyl-L-alanine amidase
MKKIIWMILLMITSSFCVAASPITTSEDDEITDKMVIEVIKTEAVEEVSFSPKEEVVQEPAPQDVVCEIDTDISNDDIELIALVTMAEAEGECEEGKRLVIDTILNRVDSISFPNTVYEVVYQPSQFSSMWNGRVDRCYIDDYICQLVEEELRNRKNYDVIFFTADKYGNYGTPMFQIGNHYFSSGE